MNRLKSLILLAGLATAPAGSLMAQTAVTHFDMSVTNGRITESCTQASYAVTSQLPVCTVGGPDGEALRFDGYSTFVKAALPTAELGTEALTVSVVLAAETYPMMRVDAAETVASFTAICGNLDEEARQGFAIELSSQGDLRLRFGSASGYLLAATGSDKLPLGRWCRVSAVMDKAANKATLYLNGREIGSSRMSRAALSHSTSEFFIGKDATELRSGPFLINTFCGLIDDIAVFNEVVVPAASEAYLASTPCFNYPSSRYTTSGSSDAPCLSLWRPQFHAMPSGGWTNECHGMTYADGRFHLFFQKNANGPYMARLHWGHVSSANLCEWTEEPIALVPSESYDIKGCWSGCVYDDGGTPRLLYTAVDNARAVIAGASPADERLLTWRKDGILVNGRPAGLSDDFRDPFYFTTRGERYIIVGTSKNGIGACTLHRWVNGSWTNDGKLFFQGTSANQHGTFWEMPNITELADGRWLFTCTPLGTGVGVRTLCWVGSIASDGTFQPEAPGVQPLELGGISRDGYGLLSPTIYRHGQQTLLLGIVPDKLPTQTNYDMGYAHTMSLPREISLSPDGTLIQRPYSGLAALRTSTAFSQTLTLSGSQSLSPVEGHRVELCGDFTVGNGAVGFRFLQSGSRGASLTYDASRGTITLDLTALNRVANDNASYGGIYTATLPSRPSAGENLRLHVFLDGSVADIFVGQRWAFSVRLFPTDPTGIAVEAFATEPTLATIQAWTLDAAESGDGIGEIFEAAPSNSSPTGMPHATAYDLAGRRLTSSHRGVFIINQHKHTR